jgi:hypothetical protein
MGHGITIPEQQKIDNPKRKKKTSVNSTIFRSHARTSTKVWKGKPSGLHINIENLETILFQKNYSEYQVKKSKTRSNY